MKKNKIFSSGTVNNLVLIKEVPHNKWHQYAKSMGLEPEYFVNSMKRWVNSDLTFFQYIEDISKEDGSPFIFNGLILESNPCPSCNTISFGFIILHYLT